MANEIEQELVDEMAAMSKDPLRWVLFSFPWGEGDLSDETGPDEWQRTVLAAIRDGLITVTEAVQIAIASGHDIGKTCLLCWIILWGLSTYENTRIIVTANTETQLKTKTWPELKKWHRLCICSHWFKYNATSLHAVDPLFRETWRADMIPWSEHNSEAFAGLHNKGKRIVLIFDEASAIPDIIWEVSEGALVDADTEILWFAFGNPTQNTGRFRECFGKFKHRWIHKQIDSRTAKISNKVKIQQWIDDYGIDSDFVKVRVLGQFPSSSSKQFIPSDLVDKARRVVVTESMVSHAATVLTLDPAWSGDDEYVIGMRKGLYFKVLWTGRQIEDDVWLAKKLALLEDEHNADAVFIDYGYGTGVYSVGKTWGRNWQLVSFGGASNDPAMLNKRGEMWNAVKTWLREGGALPADDQGLADDLVGPEYAVKMDGKIVLESKEDMKRRGIPSPNKGDSLALSFAYPVFKKHGNRGPGGSQQQVITDYDVLA